MYKRPHRIPLPGFNMDRRSSRITTPQLNALVHYMEENQEFCRGKLSPTLTAQKRTEMWEDLAKLLNSDVWGRAPPKTAAQWRKTWNDQKCHLRNKVQALTKSGNGLEHLSDIEKKMIKLIGYNSLVGVENGPESETILPNSCVEDLVVSVKPSIEGITSTFAYEASKVKQEEITKEESQSQPTEEISTHADDFISQDSFPDTNTTKKRFRDRRKYLPSAVYAAEKFEELARQKLVLLERMAIAAEKQQAATEVQASEAQKQTQLLSQILTHLNK